MALKLDLKVERPYECGLNTLIVYQISYSALMYLRNDR